VVFESRDRLAGDVLTLLQALRAQNDGRYACVMDASGILFESPGPEEPEADARLRAFLEAHRAAVLAIPAGMAADGPDEDAFEGWDKDQFLLAFVNGRVAVVMACAEAEAARAGSFDILKLMADRLLRLQPRYRLDEKGRGLFVGRPRIDIVAVGGQG
jgi:hypothetical protein